MHMHVYREQFHRWTFMRSILLVSLCIIQKIRFFTWKLLRSILCFIEDQPLPVKQIYVSKVKYYNIETFLWWMSFSVIKGTQPNLFSWPPFRITAACLTYYNYILKNFHTHAIHTFMLSNASENYLEDD